MRQIPRCIPRSIPRSVPLALRLVAAAAAAATASFSAQALILADGNTHAWPADLPIGPGDTDLGNNGLFVGDGGPGSLLADGGSWLRSGSLLIGAGASGNGNGSTLISGSGTRVELTGDGFAPGVVNRLGVGEWGRGELTVADGALLDGRANASACLGEAHWCNNFVANAAGSDGSFTVTGSGSRAQFLRGFYVGGVAVFRPPVDSFTFGTPGASSTGRVQVLAGGELVTDWATLGLAPNTASATGAERSFAQATIDGAGSLWRVTGGTLEPERYARWDTATHTNAWAQVDISNGGELRIEGDGRRYTVVNLSSGGGRTEMRIAGSGSRLHFEGESGVLQVANSGGASASLRLQDGALADGMFYLAVGRNGGTGTLELDGGSTLLRVDGSASAEARGSGGNAAAYVHLGRDGGNGRVSLRNGARLEVLNTSSTVYGTGMTLGVGAASAGTLEILDGAQVLLRTSSVAPGSSTEAWNPELKVGREGSGRLLIAGGGQLHLEGGAASTPDFGRGTALLIGGDYSWAPGGGTGLATVEGSGSLLQVGGADALVGIGYGPQAMGRLTLRDGGRLQSTILVAGEGGGTGVLSLQGASLALAGHHSGGLQSGAALVVGTGMGSVGHFSASDGSLITVSNPGSGGGGVTIGGTRSTAGGDGTMTLQASTLRLDIAGDIGAMSVGRSGSGLLRLQDAAVLDLGANALYVGRESGADGTLIASGGSTVTAGWVGVGRQRVGSADVDGGTATMVLNGASLFAQDVVIGSNGYLGGSAGAIHVSGSLVNHGIFSPGSSPGSFELDGNYVAGDGARLFLEVAYENGSFQTDLVRFGQGLALGSSRIEFRFLGDADPNAFQASGGFALASFLQQADGSGGWTVPDAALFDAVQFRARADAYIFTSFSFDAVDGAVFTAIPVPEPGSWWLWLAGLGPLAARLRRQGRPAAT